MARRLVDFMDKRVAVAKDPRSLGKALTGVLGVFWRYRVGDYRIIVSIEDKRICILVVRIGNRREVYR
jgi:mRNA interferase RelE/StbE